MEEQRDRVQMARIIIIIGFSPAAVEYSAEKVKYSDVEDIVELLIAKENGYFKHDFVASPKGNNNLCLLCHDTVAMHRQNYGF
jgi:hypothetical protein